MEPSEQTNRLLEEIRDLQRESLAEYRRVTSRSLELQEQAVARQEQIGRLYRRALASGAVLVAVLLVLLLYVMSFLR